jgi:serine/threonine protein kinase
MHFTHGICHWDLKPDNILLDSNFDIKVADFGFASSKCGVRGDYLHFSCKGTLGYMAPEILNVQICEK